MVSVSCTLPFPGPAYLLCRIHPANCSPVVQDSTSTEKHSSVGRAVRIKSERLWGSPCREGAAVPKGVPKAGQGRREGAQEESGGRTGSTMGLGRPGPEVGITIESEDVQHHAAPPPSGRPLELGWRVGTCGPRG